MTALTLPFALSGPRFIWIPCVFRLLFVPFFLVCRFDMENRRFAHYIDSDWIYFLGSIAHGLSHGYLSSLAMMYVPAMVSDKWGKPKPVKGLR